MLATLRPCSSCHRHVRYAETACPFCSAPLASAIPPRLPDLSRLSRAAQLAVGALLLAGCGADPKTGPVAPEPPVEDGGTVGTPPDPGPGAVAPMYGAPADPPPRVDQPPHPEDPGPARPMYGGPPPK